MVYILYIVPGRSNRVSHSHLIAREIDGTYSGAGVSQKDSRLLLCEPDRAKVSHTSLRVTLLLL